MPDAHVQAMCPSLSAAAAEATRVWNVMGGWFPERLPVILALLDIEHLDGLMERLLAIRGAVAEKHDG